MGSGPLSIHYTLSQVFLHLYLEISSVDYKYIQSGEILYSCLSANKNKKQLSNCNTKEVGYIFSVHLKRAGVEILLYSMSGALNSQRPFVNTICNSLGFIVFIRFSEIINVGMLSFASCHV